jgi:hypothetical protein
VQARYDELLAWHQKFGRNHAQQLDVPQGNAG